MTDPASFWDTHHRTRPATAANPLLVELAGPLAPGSALDLGCGAGGDTLWLADRGWHVTAVDISPTATGAVQDKAQTLGYTNQVTTLTMDLAQDFPAGTFDLISAHYLHSPFALPRTRLLRTAANALLPGGRLVVVDHGSTAPWSWNRDPDTRFPTPEEVAADLDLDRHHWRTERADMPKRQATGPTGQTATVIDNVLVIHRVPVEPEGPR